VFGRREVRLLNKNDLAERELAHAGLVEGEAVDYRGVAQEARRLIALTAVTN
jgi:hypothetical protein